jgi:hypothetical protein
MKTVRHSLGYGIFAVLAAALVVGCISDLGWRSLIVLGFFSALAFASWLIEG